MISAVVMLHAAAAVTTFISRQLSSIVNILKGKSDFL